MGNHVVTTMHVAPTHTSEYFEGAEVIRYGRDHDANGELVAVWYCDGMSGRAAWSMDLDMAAKIDAEVSRILIADANRQAVFETRLDALTRHTRYCGGREQYYASIEDRHVHKVADNPNTVLNGHLWIESGNQIDEGYHKQRNEA